MRKIWKHILMYVGIFLSGLLTKVVLDMRKEKREQVATNLLYNKKYKDMPEDGHIEIRKDKELKQVKKELESLDKENLKKEFNRLIPED